MSSLRKIDDIKRTLMQPALTSHYEVFIAPPGPASQEINKSRFSQEITDILTLTCSDALLPGSNLATHDLNNDFTGVTQRHAYRRVYDNSIDFTFYVNHSYDQIRYFEAWIRFISGEQVADSEKTNNFYRINYPKNYKTQSLKVTKFERNIGTAQRSNKMDYKFVNAFPISINSIPVSYDSSQLLKVTVSFSYDRYIAGNIATNSIVSQPGQQPANGTPSSPFNLTASEQAKLNSNAFQAIDLGKFSPGTFSNTNFANINDSIVPNPFADNNTSSFQLF